MIYHINNLKNKNHVIISIKTEKASDKFQHPLVIRKKKTSEIGHRGIKIIYDSLMTQMVKSLPETWEIQVLSLGWEDSPGEGNCNPLQYSCLENFKDRGAWQTTVHVFAKS